MRRLCLLLALPLFLAACSSMNKPPTPGRPEIDIRQQTALFFGSGGEAPLNLSVTIRNPAKEPILVRRVRITAGMGMTQYSVYPVERIVHETLAPGETKEINLTATAYTEIARLNPTEPLGLRAFIDFDSGGKHHREVYVLPVVSQ